MRPVLFVSALPVPMRFSLTTWNINSVRLRIDIVAKFLKSVRPDVLCLQETKCIDDAFPLKRSRGSWRTARNFSI
jgi:exonuclease III